MNQTNNWLKKADLLCGEIGPEDGIDPRIIAYVEFVLKKCLAVQGYLRSAIATTVKRKRVPLLKFEWVARNKEDGRDAYFKNNQ